MNPPNRRAEIALGGIAFIWGSTFVLVKSALDDISTVLFITLRFGVAALLLALIYRRRLTLNRAAIAGGVFAGLFLFAGYWLQTAGLFYTTAAKSGFITGLYIVVVPLLSAVLYRKPPTPTEWAGVSVAAVGMSLMALPSGVFAVNPGDLLTLGCAFAFAVHLLLLAHYAQHFPYESLALTQIATCGVLGALSFWWTEEPFVRWKPAVLVALAVTSVFATALAFAVQTWAQRYTTATRAAVILALEPVFAWITAFAVVNEVLSWRAMAGAICILAGILLVELKPEAAQ